MSARPLAALVLALSCADPQAPPTEAGTPEPEPVVVTQWTDRTELFVEFPPLRPGVTSRFLVHLTDLESFEPVREGHVEVTLAYGGGDSESFAASSPTRPGIFGVDVVPPRRGIPAITLTLQSHGLQDSHPLGPIPVGEPESGDSAIPARGVSHEGIAFLKEQQWGLDFATEIVSPASIRESFLVPATVEARSGGRLAVTAPVAGRLLPTQQLPVLGESLEDGQEIAAIAPLEGGPADRIALQLAIDQSTLALESATRERQRADRLLEAGAVPERRLQDAVAHEALVAAQLNAATRQMDRYETMRRDAHELAVDAAFAVRSHLAGVVTSVLVKDGAHVKEGEVILEVTATDTVHVSGAIPESRTATLRGLAGAEVQLPGSGDTVPVGPLVTIGRIVDPATRTLEVTYVVKNRGQLLALGQAILLRLYTSSAAQAPGVPVSAVVSRDGVPLVYVQTGGETFEERRVVLGSRAGQIVQVESGLEEGERVVTKGAYLIRLASMSTESLAHGHVH